MDAFGVFLRDCHGSRTFSYGLFQRPRMTAHQEGFAHDLLTTHPSNEAPTSHFSANVVFGIERLAASFLINRFLFLRPLSQLFLSAALMRYMGKYISWTPQRQDKSLSAASTKILTPKTHSTTEEVLMLVALVIHMLSIAFGIWGGFPGPWYLRSRSWMSRL